MNKYGNGHAETDAVIHPLFTIIIPETKRRRLTNITGAEIWPNLHFVSRKLTVSDKRITGAGFLEKFPVHHSRHETVAVNSCYRRLNLDKLAISFPEKLRCRVIG